MTVTTGIEQPTEGGAAAATDRRLGRIAAAVAVLCLVAFLAGAAWQQNRQQLGGWQTGVAHVGDRVFTIQKDGWAYGASDAVPTWIDRAGSWHDGGWPSCLVGRAGQDVTVRFQARVVTIDGQSTRPVVAIDCR